MSFLADIKTYYAANSTLTNALPANSVYLGVAPEGQAFPYLVLTSISNLPQFTTGADYFSTFNFQLSLYHTDPIVAESIANTIAGQFDFTAIVTGYFAAVRTGGPFLLVDSDTPKRVYHCYLEYQLNKNLTHGNT